jgi:hypothetical protein
MRALLGLTFLLLAACASQPDIVPAGQDTYMASRAGAIYVPITELRANVLHQAGEFCDKRNMTFAVISSSSTPPPYLPGNPPEIEIQFRCVDHETAGGLARNP